MIKTNDWESCLEKVYNDPSIGKRPSVLLSDLCVHFRISHPKFFDHEDNDRLRHSEGVLPMGMDRVYKEKGIGRSKMEAKRNIPLIFRSCC
jgi:hypothetical protein